MPRKRNWLGRFADGFLTEERKPLLRAMATVLSLALILAALLAAVQLVPEWQVRHASVQPTRQNPPKEVTPADVAALQNEMRKTFIQVVGGAFAILALYFTYRRVRVAEQGHITDRYTKAIEQLGALTAAGQPNIEVRLGAIYALERIARDSARDHWTIMEVLTAYVRQNAAAPATEPTKEENEAAIKKGPRTEIQAILTVLSRRKRDPKREREDQCLDLRRTDLRGASLNYAHLERADFGEAHAEGASFFQAHAEGASFFLAHVEGVYFSQAHVEKTSFVDAYAEGADFSQAHAERADFWDAHVGGARFFQAHLEGAGLLEAHLEGASLREAHVGGADFRRPEGLTVEQFQKAIGWEQARFDDEFRRALEATQTEKPTPTPTPPSGK
jgi:uncharacterized protein YjbI with pentapeptide repeats